MSAYENINHATEETKPTPGPSQRRMGVVGIIVDDRATAAPKVNQILSEFGHIIVARTGLPYKERGLNIIAIIVDATTNELGALTGRLGMLHCVRVKSLML